MKSLEIKMTDSDLFKSIWHEPPFSVYVCTSGVLSVMGINCTNNINIEDLTNRTWLLSSWVFVQLS